MSLASHCTYCIVISVHVVPIECQPVVNSSNDRSKSKKKKLFERRNSMYEIKSCYQFHIINDGQCQWNVCINHTDKAVVLCSFFNVLRIKWYTMFRISRRGKLNVCLLFFFFSFKNKFRCLKCHTHNIPVSRPFANIANCNVLFILSLLTSGEQTNF